MKLVFTIKTHHISASIIRDWLDIMSSDHVEHCFILLNNHDNILDNILATGVIHPAIREYIVPFTMGTFAGLGLPIFSKQSVGKNSWANGDYGFYLMADFLSKKRNISSDCFLFQIDHDLAIYGTSYRQLIDKLYQHVQSNVAILLSHEKITTRNKGQYPAASLAYEGSTAYKTLFGFQGLPIEAIRSLHRRRIEQFEDIKSKLAKDETKRVAKSNPKVDLGQWPICETFIGTEVNILGMNVINLAVHKDFEQYFHLYRVHLPKVRTPGEPNFTKGSYGIFHPNKCSNYSMYEALKNSRTCVVNLLSPEFIDQAAMSLDKAKDDCNQGIVFEFKNGSKNWCFKNRVVFRIPTCMFTHLILSVRLECSSNVAASLSVSTVGEGQSLSSSYNYHITSDSPLISQAIDIKEIKSMTIQGSTENDFSQDAFSFVLTGALLIPSVS